MIAYPLQMLFPGLTEGYTFVFFKNWTDGIVLVYLALFVICCLMNKKVAPKENSWIPPLLFTVGQFVFMIGVTTIDEGSALIMLIIFILALFKTWYDWKHQNEDF